MKLILIETVGSYNSGLGHLTRMNVLKDELVNSLDPLCAVVISDGSTDRTSGYDLAIIDVDSEREALLRVESIKTLSPETKIILLRNDTYWSKKVEGVDEIITTGWSNVILHPAFREFERQQWNENIEHIVVFQGGSDPWGIAPRILYALDLLLVEARVSVIVGSAISDLTLSQINSFKEYTKLRGEVYYDLTQEGMAAVLATSDLVIMPPGQSWAEATAMEVPAVFIGHHDRHLRVMIDIIYYEAAYMLGVGPELKDVELLEGLNAGINFFSNVSVRREIVENAGKIVDKEGINKIMEIVKYVAQDCI